MFLLNVELTADHSLQFTAETSVVLSCDRLEVVVDDFSDELEVLRSVCALSHPHVLVP